MNNRAILSRAIPGLIGTLGMLSVGVAQERTAEVIEDLVSQVNVGVTTYRKHIDQWWDDNDWQHESAEQIRQSLGRATDPEARETLRARYVQHLAGQNASDRAHVAAAVEALEGVIPTFRELMIVVTEAGADRFGGRAHVEELTVFVQRVVTNTIIASDRKAEEVTDPELIDRLHGLQGRLIAEDELYDVELGPEQSMERMRRAYRQLESAYVGLRQVLEALESERTQYSVAIMDGVVNVAAGFVDSSGAGDFGTAVRDRLLQRLRDYRGIEKDDRPRRRPGRSLSPANQERLRSIRERGQRVTR